MKLPFKLTSLDQVDEQYRDLYTKQDDGTFLFEGVDGIKTQEDVNRLQTALNNARAEETKLKGYLSAYNKHGTVEEVTAALERIPALEEAAKGKVDESKINDLVNQRLNNVTMPLKQQIEQLTTQISEKDTLIKDFSAKDTRRTITDEIRKGCAKVGVAPEVLEDIIALTTALCTKTEDGSVVTNEQSGCQGLSIEVWLQTQRQNRPYWFGESRGAGAGGSGGGKGGSGENPWTHDGWNITKQGIIMRDDPAKAEQLAKAAGTTVNGNRPDKK